LIKAEGLVAATNIEMISAETMIVAEPVDIDELVDDGLSVG
jgi:hypothetical protein